MIGGAGSTLQRTGSRLALAATVTFIPALLLYSAIPRFVAGVKIERFHNLVVKTTLGGVASPRAAELAAKAFGEVSDRDGDDKAEEAEFRFIADGNGRGSLTSVYKALDLALADSPTNPRAWTILCSLEAQERTTGRVACLDRAFPVTRYDWFTSAARMRLVAFEWPYLDEPLRDEATEIILPMWYSVQPNNGWTLRGVLYELSTTESGRQLLRAGLIGDKEALRSFNRYVIEEQMNGG